MISICIVYVVVYGKASNIRTKILGQVIGIVKFGNSKFLFILCSSVGREPSMEDLFDFKLGLTISDTKQ
jgi:hypothetical protein